MAKHGRLQHVLQIGAAAAPALRMSRGARARDQVNTSLHDLPEEIMRYITELTIAETDLPEDARDPIVYPKPPPPDGVAWPVDPLTQPFSEEAARAVWDILLRLARLPPGDPPRFTALKWHGVWKGNPTSTEHDAIKVLLAFPWPKDPVSNSTNLAKRNRYFWAGLWGKILPQEAKVISERDFVKALMDENGLRTVRVKINAHLPGVTDLVPEFAD